MVKIRHTIQKKISFTEQYEEINNLVNSLHIKNIQEILKNHTLSNGVPYSRSGCSKPM